MTDTPSRAVAPFRAVIARGLGAPELTHPRGWPVPFLLLACGHVVGYPTNGHRGALRRCEKCAAGLRADRKVPSDD